MLIEPGQVEMKTVVNKATNEQLSVTLHEGWIVEVEVKRTRSPKEKKKNSQNN